MSPGSRVNNDYVLTDLSRDNNVFKGNDYVTSGNVANTEREVSTSTQGHIMTASGDVYATVDKRIRKSPGSHVSLKIKCDWWIHVSNIGRHLMS